MLKLKKSTLIKLAVTFLCAGVSGTIFATDSYQSIGTLATNVTSSFQSLVQLMIAVSYLLGVGFSGAAIFKFKQHKDNPTQIPIGTPIALLVVGIMLIFLPGLVGPIGQTIFGSNVGEMTGGPTGTGANIPGMDSTTK
jgi:intracellular multiplication protein IcmD